MTDTRFEHPAPSLPCEVVSPVPAPTAGTTEPTTGDGAERSRSRRGALQVAAIAVLAALGVREVAAKPNWTSSEQHRNRNGHDHGKRGKRGKAGPGGPSGSPGSSGEKSEKGDKGDHGDQGTQGAQGDTGPQGSQGPGTMLTGTTSWNPGFLFSSESRSTMVEVPGAAVGDPVLVGLSSIGQFSIDTLAMPIYGYVKFEGFVAVTITNLTGTSEIVRDGTLTVVVVKP